MYNKMQFNKIDDKKVLHKINKQWVVISLSMLAMIGAGGLITTKTHANTVTPQVKSQSVNAQANLLHKQLLLNSSKPTSVFNNKDNVSYQQVRSNNKLPTGIDGMWNNAYYTFNSNTGALKVYGKRINDKDNLKNNKGINTLSAIRIPSNYSVSSPQYQSDMAHYPSNDIHHNVNPNDIKSITINDDGLVQLPNNSSYMFANLPNVISINLTGMHTPAENNTSSDITSTSHMFSNDPKLRSITLSKSINPADVNDMSSMFSDDPLLTRIDFGLLSDTNHASDLSNMFAGDRDLSAIKTALIAKPNTNLQGMFSGDKSLGSLDLSHFDTADSSVDLMNNMLNGTTGLRTLKLGPNTALNNDVGLPNEWYRRYMADNYTDSSSTNLTNGKLIPGIYTTNKDMNPKPDNSCITGTWNNSAYSFDKRTGVLHTTKGGELEALIVTGSNGHKISSLQGMSLSDLDDVTEIDIDQNNTFLPVDHNDFAGLPNLKKVDLSGLNTRGMTNTSYMFANDPSLKEIDFGNHFDTGKIADMSGMFNNDRSLVHLDLSQFKTGNVTNMSWMFGNDPELTGLNLSNFNTVKLSDMYAMFYGDTSLKSVIFGNQFNTANVSNMSWMFSNDADLSSLDLSNFNTNKADNMENMFSGDVNLTDLKLGNQFHTARVSNMNEMFDGDAKLSNLNLSSINSIQAFNNNKMSDMLSGLTNLTKLQLGRYTYIRKNADLPNTWYKEMGNGYTTRDSNSIYTTSDSNKPGYVFTNVPGTYVLNRNVNPTQLSDSDITGNWGTASFKFNPITGLLQTTSSGVINPIQRMSKAIDLSKIKEIKFARGTKAPIDSTGLLAGKYTTITTSDGMSEQKSSLANLSDVDCTNLDTSDVINMFEMFQNDVNLKSIQFGNNFNTKKVQLMGYMFNNDYRLNSVDLSHFNTNRVYDMRSMFCNDYELSDINLSNFNTSRVSFISNMFNGDHVLSKLNLGQNFDTSNMSHTSSSMRGMFANDYHLKTLNLGNKFYTSNLKTSVEDISGMFTNDFSLTSLDLGKNFDTSKVSDMHGMFANDNNLQNVDLGNNFDTTHAATKTYPKKIRVKNDNGSDTMRQAYTRVNGKNIPNSYKGSSDVFANDKRLNTISGKSIKLDNSVNLPVISGKNWFLKGTRNQVNLTDGKLYFGTYVFKELTNNPIVQTVLQFMDGSRKIGSLMVTGYSNTLIPYGEIEDSLGDGYSTDIKNLYKTIPNSPYKYINGTVKVPVRRNGSSTGSYPVSATYITLIGNVTLNFFNYADKKIKSLKIPYRINGVPVGFKINDVLSYVTSGVNTPSDYLGKTIQSFPISDYSYQSRTSSNVNEYLNVPIPVSDGKNTSGIYVNGKYVNDDLIFNFKSNKVNEHVTYMYKNTKEGSDDIQGTSGTKGNDVYMDGLKSGFVLAPNTDTSFTFTNKGSRIIRVKPGQLQVTVPFKVEDDSSHQILAGLSNLRSMNRIPVNKDSVISLNSTALKTLRDDGYQLDNNPSITVPLDKVNAVTHIYNGDDFVLYAHKISVTVPVQFMYNGQQKGTGSLTGTMHETINNLSSRLTSSIPLGYRINSNNSYRITNATKALNNKYYTKPLVINVIPVRETDVINFIDNEGHRIGQSITKQGNDYRTVNGVFNVDTLSAPEGYQITSAGTLPYDGHSHSVTVTPNKDFNVPTRLVDTQTGRVVVPSQKASNKFAIDVPSTTQISEVPRGYQLAKSNHYSFTLKNSDVTNNRFNKAPLSFGITPVNYTISVLLDYDNSADDNPIFNESTIKNVDSSFNLLSYVKSVMPENYEIKPGQNLNNWKLINNLPASGKIVDPIIIRIMPVQQKALVVYKKGNTSINITPVSLGSGDTNKLGLASSKFRIGLHPNKLPKGYQILNPNQIIYYNDKPQLVDITPIQATDTINYTYNGHNISTNHITGNKFIRPNNFNTNSLNLPNGYSLADDGQIINYDGNVHNIMVKPVANSNNAPISMSTLFTISSILDMLNTKSNGSNKLITAPNDTINSRMVPNSKRRTISKRKVIVKYAKVIKTLKLYNSRNFTRKNMVKAIKPGTSLKIERAVKAHNGALHYEIHYNNKNYFITADQHQVKVLSKNTKRHTNFSHFYLKVLKALRLHTSAKFTKHNGVKVIYPGTECWVKRTFKGRGMFSYEVVYNGHDYFITANPRYTTNAYLQRNDFRKRGSKIVKVIKPVYEYANVHFSGKYVIRRCHRGTVLAVRRLVVLTSSDMTRLQLVNGRYLTANKNCVKVVK